MKLRNTMISLVAVAALFTACGGGGSTTSTDDDDPAPIVGDFELKTKTNYDVLANKTTYVSVLTGDDYINTENGQSYYEYSLVDRGTASLAVFDTRGYGILKYTNSGVTDTVKISIKDTRTNDVIEADLTFTVTDESEASEIKILKTDQSIDDAGLDRDFTRGSSDGDDVIDNVNNITWDDDTSNFGNFSGGDKTFAAAKQTCISSGYRLPTEEELLTTVQYADGRYQSETYENNLLDLTFQARAGFFWADSGRAIGYSTGRFTAGEQASFRCVKDGSLSTDTTHLTYTTDDVDNITYDESTGLMWTQASSDSSDRMTYADGKTYCEAKGWKMPTINQLRSLSDNGLISSAVIGDNSTLLSSTEVESNNLPYHLFVTLTDGRSTYRVDTASETDKHAITCVKEQ